MRFRTKPPTPKEINEKAAIDFLDILYPEIIALPDEMVEYL
jgi:hypothetical protein